MLKTITACLVTAGTVAAISNFASFEIPPASQELAVTAAIASQKKECIFIAWDQQRKNQDYIATNASCENYANFRNPADADSNSVLASTSEKTGLSKRM